MPEHLPIEQTPLFADFVTVADWIWERVSQWDKLAKDTIGTQLIRAADSVGANLVEGDGRYGKGDGLHFLVIARASARETRYWLERSCRRGLLSTQETDEQISTLTAATKQLNALITYRRNASSLPRCREEEEIYNETLSTDATSFLNTQHLTLNT
jgi:four helix bundle protein